ncbi:MAG: KpsF/GutQ family sugar-phosphate isomerase [Acidobacteriota bacterium]
MSATGTANPAAPRPPKEVARWVLGIEAAAIHALIDQLDEAFERAVHLLRGLEGRVVCSGMGKSGLVMKKVAATLASTGTPSLFLHPAEAIHGDLGMITRHDAVLAASYSGTTDELVRLVDVVKRLGVPLIVMTGNADSPLARHADLHLRTEIDREACPLNLAPTASTAATLALGDALAMALLEARGFSSEDFARLHPGGRLGKRLLRVRELMHRDDALPRVGPETTVREAIFEMSRGKLGITAVVADDGRLLGCLSDGDLRRLLEHDEGALGTPVETVMTRSPQTLDGDRLAPEALRQMEAGRITALFVLDPEERLEGIVHLHDLWRLELF